MVLPPAVGEDSELVPDGTLEKVGVLLAPDRTLAEIEVGLGVFEDGPSC